MRILLLCFLALTWPITAAPLEPIETFLDQHCYDCHDGETTKGDLDLTELGFDLSNPGDFSQWVDVLDRVEAGEMPPKEKKRPPAAETEAVLSWMHRGLTAADRKRQETSGRVPLRRLNRTEYEYTLRDLLSLPQLEVRGMLPPDGADHGFDNVSSALDLSYVQMRRYLDAADAALDAAIQLAPPTPSTGRPLPNTRRGTVRQCGFQEEGGATDRRGGRTAAPAELGAGPVVVW